jgi:hypothetical protein
LNAFLILRHLSPEWGSRVSLCRVTSSTEVTGISMRLGGDRHSAVDLIVVVNLPFIALGVARSGVHSPSQCHRHLRLSLVLATIPFPT